MFIVTAVVSALLAAVLLLSATGKLRRDEGQLATMRKVGFPEDRLWLLASAEIAGAVGLVAGLFWWPLGVAAGVGIVLYFVGALASHLLKRDWKVAPPAALLAVGALALVLRAATA
jgi:hypothetical protein